MVFLLRSKNISKHSGEIRNVRFSSSANAGEDRGVRVFCERKEKFQEKKELK